MYLISARHLCKRITNSPDLPGSVVGEKRGVGWGFHTACHYLHIAINAHEQQRVIWHPED